MGSVYLFNIKGTDLYKIGITRKKPIDRLKSLQTGNPHKLLFIESYESENFNRIETIMHRQLKHMKYQREDFEDLIGEWFILTNIQAGDFLKLCKRIDENIEIINKTSTLPETKRLL